MLSANPNSFLISRMAKKEGCEIKYIESPIAKGDKRKAEMETPNKVLLYL